MDSSSDASFAWTDASNDTIDSVSMVKTKMNKSYSEDESVSGKSYKKKLQEELFVKSKEVQEEGGRLGQTKRKWRGDQSEGHEVHSPKKKWRGDQSESDEVHSPKKKWRGDQSESDEVHSPKKKKIKREPESDHDVSTNKNKNNGIHHSESQDSHDESYLNLKVKDEQHFASPNPTNTRRSRQNSLLNSDILNEATHTKSKKKSTNNSMSDTLPEDNILNKLVQEERECNERSMKKKKKKSKKSKDSTLSDDEKTINSDVEGSAASEGYHVPGAACSPGDRSSLPGASGEGVTIDNNLKEMGNNEANNHSSMNQNKNDSEKRKTRISGRIQFEEESSDLEIDQFENTKPSNKPDILKKYGKENLHLKPLKTTLENNQAALTTDDEIWLIRCPKEVHVDSFLNKQLNLEGRCKVKLSGQTYEGTVDHEAGNMSLLSSEQNHFVIKSWLVKGFLNLRKRIPKTYLQGDIALNISQPSFIPLPETKSRHPLFGYNYKKCIKLSASVTERLNAHASSQFKESKSQKEKTFNCEQDHYPMTRPKEECSTGLADANGSGVHVTEPEQAGSRKKNKHEKHRHQDAAPKKKKKHKHDLESVEAWDSEKAIEENLFNF